ncbi:MAG: alpha/beta hydrolase [Acidimicrobiia bacterium]|nr:alpha/beta hydrolase [Acidimicrobiia bacterium]
MAEIADGAPEEVPEEAADDVTEQAVVDVADELVPRHDVPRGGRSGFTVVDDRQVHYLEWGGSSSPPVVCLHGGGQTAYMWEQLGAALADRFHVVAPDLPGHGDSDALRIRGEEQFLDRRALVAAIRPLMVEFGLERAVFVGASLGGITSLTLGVMEPDVVEAIVLVDIGHKMEKDGVRRIIEFMTAHESFTDLDEAAAAVAEYLPRRKDVRVESLRRNLRKRPDGRWEWKHNFGRRIRQRQAEGRTFDIRRADELVRGMADDAARLTCPVLVLRGKESDLLSDEGAREITDLIPNARLSRIAGAGHHAAGDNPTTTVDLIDEFLTEIAWA